MKLCGEIMLEDARYKDLVERVRKVRWKLRDYAISGWNEVHPKEYHALERKEIRLTRCLLRAVNFRTKFGKWV